MAVITPEMYSRGADGSEHAHQVALFIWVAQTGAKQWPELDLLHAIPNGGERAKIVAARLKAEGVKSGVSDLFLPVARQGMHGLYIEMKRPFNTPELRENSVSENQTKWIDNVRGQGYGAIVCYGWQEARDILIRYMGNTS